MEKDWIEMLSEKNQIQKVLEVNRQTEVFGLALTEQDAKWLVEQRSENLKEQGRVEFGEGILPKLIFTFCDSVYIDRNNYVDTIGRLQEIFYFYKNESMDELSDDELLDYMREVFDGKCEGSLEYLEGTALEEFARKIRREGHFFLGDHYKLGGRAEDD